jgi:YVTN family beta-propeller protein
LINNQVVTQIATVRIQTQSWVSNTRRLSHVTQVQNLSVIDPSNNTVVATIDVGGKPETAVSDGKGKVFVNIEDKMKL